jgi:hypothetical protein
MLKNLYYLKINIKNEHKKSDESYSSDFGFLANFQAKCASLVGMTA